MAVVRALLEEGAQVALVDADPLRLDSVVRFLRGAVLAVPCNVAEADAVHQAHGQVEAGLGPVDIVVHIATVHSTDKSDATSDDDWRRALAANLDSAFYWARTALPGMKQRGWGRIVHVGSLAAKDGSIPAGAACAASMGALASLTFALAREGAAEGVTVNAIAPAGLKTPETIGQLNEQQQRQILARIPVGRFCELDEFAHAVLFLLSPRSGFITGEVLDLNGGLHMD